MDARLIVDPPARGSWNMAVDEMLFASHDADPSAVLRLYQWCEPTLSLGYFQQANERTRHVASQRLPMVRRSTGGGAIIHDHELTYSLIVRLADQRPATARAVMLQTHQTLISLLNSAGVSVQACIEERACTTESECFLCFQRHTVGDILCEGSKVVGSAQRRQRTTLLQHGSILLSRSSAAPELPGVHDLARVHFPATRLIEDWPERVASLLAVEWKRTGLSASEQAAARESRKQSLRATLGI